MESLLNEQNIWVFILAILWTLPWKGYALWTSSQRRDKKWFIVLIILNTFAILDIFYIFYVAKKVPKDISNSLKSKV